MFSKEWKLCTWRFVVSEHTSIIREYGSTLYIGIAMVFCVTFGPM